MASLTCASKTLFVGNLHASLEESDLLDIFKQFGRIIECCKRWCHYGFIQFASEEEAKQAYLSLNGSKVRGRPMRIEFQRKKLRNLQALFEAESEYTQMNENCFNFNLLNNDFNANENENMDIQYEKHIEKFFDDLMDDQKSVQTSRVLGSLDINSPLSKVHKTNEVKRLKIRLSDKENIDKKAFKTVQQKTFENNSPNQLISDSFNIKVTSSCSSPISFKDTSPKSTFSNASVMLFRSINNSHTICVEPTDVLEPLNEGDFAEYKLFPNSGIFEKKTTSSDDSLKQILEGLDRKAYQQTSEMLMLTDYTPQSLSLSCSSASSVPSSLANSPINFMA